ncbi:MAG: hypothetical protein JW717_12250 [Marinilabiliaceae bacterium]|nr:hypothetical protein [Marinilabiliaceae bacterium]
MNIKKSTIIIFRFRHPIFYLFPIWVFSLSHSFAQESITAKYNSFTHLTHHEKLFVCTDKNIYLSGNTIWFSTWLLNAGSLSPEKFEKILEVNLIKASSGEHVVKQIVSIENGRSTGQIDLPQGLENGWYRLVGNTNYMKNQGAEFFFSKSIYIQSNFKTINSADLTVIEKESGGNVSTKLENSIITNVTIPSEKSELNIQFMPEGGNLVPDIPSRLAFIGTLPNADTVLFTGTIYDDENKPVAFFKPEFRGRGAISFTPLTGKKYHATVTDSKGISFKVDLPLTDQNSKYTLSVINRWNNPNLIININKSSSASNYDSLKLIVVQHGDVLCNHKFLPKESVNSISLEKKLLKTGIAQITLFTHNNVPLCERLVFNNNNDLTTWETNIRNTTNGNTILNIIPINDKGRQKQGDYAISVSKIDCQSDTFYKTPDIIQYLLLNSDLPGLENDCDYFFKNDNKSAYYSDLTMLTNGWRRYTWEQVLADSIPSPKYPLEHNFYIAGSVKRQGNGKHVPEGIELTLMGNGEDVIAGSARTNVNGEFYFPIDYFNNGSEFTIQTKNRLNVKTNFNIELKTNLVDYLNDDSSTNLTFTKKSLPIIGQHHLINDTEKIFNDQPLSDNQIRITEPTFRDTADISLPEVTVDEMRILSPMEKMHERYGPPGFIVGSKQLGQINSGNNWNYGLISLIEQIIPGFHYRTKFVEAHHAFGGLKACNCPKLDIEERLHDQDECFEFSYNGQSHFRFFIYVDGRLCAFTNHAGQVDWAKDHLFTMNILDIETISFIEHPKNDATADAFSVIKRAHELYCSPAYAPHILNNCLVGFDPAPSRIISIKTKSGLGISGTPNNNGIVTTRLFGFTPAKEFYIPKQNSKSNSLKQGKANYWNPAFKTDVSGAVTINLPPLDQSSDYLLTLNGLNNRNEPTTLRWIIKNSLKNDSSNTVNALNNQPQNDSTLLIRILTQENNPCNFALVWSGSGKLKKQTAVNGELMINVDSISGNDSIFVSVPNYGNTSFVNEEINDSIFTVNVSYNVINSNNVSSNQTTINDVLKRDSRNLSLTPYFINGIFRQQVYLQNTRINLSDITFTQRIAGYKDRLNPVMSMVEDIHQLQNPNYKQLVPFEFNFEKSDFIPLLDARLKNLTFLSSDASVKYDFRYIGSQLFNNRQTSVYYFTPKNNEPLVIYEGIILIDNLTTAIAHVQWNIASDKRESQSSLAYLAPSKRNYDFKLITDMCHATYVFSNGLWKLLSASEQLQFLYNKTPYTVNSELLITNYLSGKRQKFKKTIPGKTADLRK